MNYGVCLDPIKELERRKKISEAHKGRIFSEESREKMKDARKLRAPISDQARKKMSVSHIGKRPSNERLLKMSAAWKGPGNPNFGKHPSEETLKRMSEAHKGKSLSKETRRKIGDAIKGKRCGENHPMWHGGTSFEPYCPKFNNEFKERVRAFFRYQCVECGSPQNEIRLHVHHVNFNKQTCCDSSTPLFVSLCPACHNKTQKNRFFWEYWFTEMINHLYGGKCYVSVDVARVRGEMPGVPLVSVDEALKVLR